MAASRVRAGYSELAQIAKSFGSEADSTRQTLSRLRQQKNILQGKDWVGKGADKFYAEMDSAVLPMLNRLVNALETAQRITTQISQIMKRAEEESAALLRGEGSGGAGGVGGTGSAGTGGSSSGGASGAEGSSGPGGGSSSAGGASQSAAQQQNPLLARDPNGLFTDGYMRSLVDSHFQGENSRELRNAMNELAGNPTGADLDRVLGRIAELRGRPVNEIKAEYQKYLQIRAQRDANNPNPPPDLARYHPTFMGSNSQLRYGKIVGDAFGVDPIFGSLLNPSGGLTGPGNTAFDADSTAVGYHSIVHDAAGYLYNYHQTGPGYDYLGREGRDTSDPLSGQREGIRYWRNTMGGVNPGSAASEGIMRVVVGGADAYHWASDKISKIRNIF